VDIKEMTARAVEGSIHYHHSFCLPIPTLENHRYPTKIVFSNLSSLQAARMMTTESDSVTVLNFASAKNPGGGFIGGAIAQEECIARSSMLYPCLMKFFPLKDHYFEINRTWSANRERHLYSNCAIFSPRVPVIKTDTRDATHLDSPYTCSVITIPAPNTGVYRSANEKDDINIENVLRERIDRVLSIALVHEAKDLVLGAFGCGVFRNNPFVVATIFKTLLDGKFQSCFRTAHFAILTRKPTTDRNLCAFLQVFQPSESNILITNPH